MPTLTQLPTGKDDDEHAKLNLEDEVREFVGDFNKFFEELKEWTEDAVEIRTWREFFEKSIPRCSAILLWILTKFQRLGLRSQT